jgi:hypothetical protein
MMSVQYTKFNNGQYHSREDNILHGFFMAEGDEICQGELGKRSVTSTETTKGDLN